MTATALSGCMQRLRQAAAIVEHSCLADRELLQRFFQHGEEDAFAALIRRHGPMVLSVCRRSLRDSHDAEDAFQATFLVLVRKGHALASPDRLGPWLYGVACRTAQKARSAVSARAKFERSSMEDASGVATVPSARLDSDVLDWLDVELSRLPDKYREPIVLCYLQGQSKREAASRLGWPEGTVSARLDRARKLLKERLSRRGIALGAAGLAGMLASLPADAAVPAALTRRTFELAFVLLQPSAFAYVIPFNIQQLTEGVIRTMYLNKFKAIAIAIVATLAVGLVTTGLTQKALANRAGTPAASEPAPGDFSATLFSDTDDLWSFPVLVRAEKGEKKPLGDTVQGTVKSVDAAKKTIVVQIPKLTDGKKGTEEKSFELAADVRIQLHDVITKTKELPEGKLADLTEGTRVNLQLDADNKKVVLVGAQGPGLHGSVKSASGDSITVMLKGKDGKTEETFELIKDAKIILHNPLAKKTDPQTEGKLADLTENTPVHLQLTVDRKRVLGIGVMGRSMVGRLSAYDAGNSTITISVKEDGQLVDKTFTIAKDARLGDLNVGEVVVLQFSPTDKEKVVMAQGKKSE